MAAEPFDQPTGTGPGESSAVAVVERRFTVGQPARVTVRNPRGRVQVTSWDQPEVHVRAWKIASATPTRDDDITRIEVDQEGETIVARTVLDGSSVFRDGKIWTQIFADGGRSLADVLKSVILPAEVIYEIRVPRRTDLDVAVVSSGVEIAHLDGMIAVRSVSGSLALQDLDGQIDVATVSGALTARDLVGSVAARSVSGKLSLQGRLDRLHAASVSGSIELGGPLVPGGRYDFHTVSGNVTLRLPREIGATIEARGVSLEVTTDLPVEVTRERRGPGLREWIGCLQRGGALVTFGTVSGRLALLGDGPVGAIGSKASAVIADASPAGSEISSASPLTDSVTETAPDRTTQAGPEAESAQLRILRALERGEIPVDEALRQLEALRTGS